MLSILLVPSFIAIGIAAILFLVLWKVLLIPFPWLKYDAKLLYLIFRAGMTLRKQTNKNPQHLLIDTLEENATHTNTKNKSFIIHGDEKWTYSQLNTFSNYFANQLHKNIKPNETVGLMMTSQPLFVAVWFGITKTGGIAAFINHDLQKKSLLQAIDVCQCKNIAIEEIESELVRRDIKVYLCGSSQNNYFYQLKYKLNTLDESIVKTPIEWRAHFNFQSDFCLIFTSGTTGFPKACHVTFLKCFFGAHCLTFFGVKRNDIIYCPLPCYHSAASIVGVLGTLKLGATIILRKKFSFSYFWEECVEHKATVIQYIGESIHYVCNEPPRKEEKENKVWLALGNGLQKSVWTKFSYRVGGKINIGEIYTATEGNFALFDLDYHFGSIGMLSPLLKKLRNATLIKYDYENEKEMRSNKGRCIETALEEPGLLICKITDQAPFAGYVENDAATQRKILKDVFTKGDMYFNSGDILLRDKHYRMSFVDRVGDTFRWKGENVSTNHVENVLQDLPFIAQANVYGVTVQGHEGRCGMMAITLCEDTVFKGSELFDVAKRNLPKYAIPIFIRICSEHKYTGTLKLIKMDMVKDGYDRDRVGMDDELYIIDYKQENYVPLTDEIVSQLLIDDRRI